MRIAGLLLLLIGTLVGALLFHHVWLSGQHDFLPFYLGGKLAASGHIASLYDKQAYQHLVEALRNEGVRMSAFDAHYFIRPAFQAFLYIPFTFLPYSQASVLALAGNFGLLGILVWKLPIWFVIAPRFRLALRSALAVFYPFVWSICVGQDTLLLTLLIAYSLFRASKRDEVLAGFVIGACAWKPHLMWLTPLALIAARKWRMAISCLVTSSFLLLLSFAAVGVAGFRQWLQLVQAPSSDIRPYVMGNIRALNIHLGLGVAGFVLLLSLICFAVVLRRAALHEGFAAAVILALFVSPHTYWQDYSLMAVIAMLCTSSLTRCYLLMPWPYIYGRTDALPMIFLALVCLVTLAAKPDFSCLRSKRHPGVASIGRT